MSVRVERVTAQDDLSDLAGWFAAQLRREPSYISHSEILWGRAADADNWSVDLEAVLRLEFLGAGPEVHYVAVLDGERVLALSVTRLDRVGERAVLTLEDLIVDPAGRRCGHARRLLEEAERRAGAEGAAWIALESGIRNEGAHGFFAALGYAPVSKVMLKRAPGA